MLKRLETDKSLSAFAGQFVPLKLTTSGKNGDWASWVKRYRYEGKAIPILFVIRADGEQLYGRSGSLAGDALPEMLSAAMQQSGRVLNANEYDLLQSCTTAAAAALDEQDYVTAAKALAPVSQIGPPGNLGSFAAPALLADELAVKVVEQMQQRIGEAEQKLRDPDAAFDGLMTIVSLDRVMAGYPLVHDRTRSLVKAVRRDRELRVHYKPAVALLRARESVESKKSRDRKHAENLYSAVITRFPDSPAHEIARKELAQLNPQAEILLEKTPDLPAEPVRRWTDKSGSFSIQARLLEVTKDGNVKLQKEDGKTVVVSIDRLGAADRRYLRDRQ